MRASIAGSTLVLCAVLMAASEEGASALDGETAT